MDAVVQQSEASIRKGSSSFDAASRLFGKTLREDVWQLYAWCRHCDDEIDGQDHGHDTQAISDAERRERLARLRRLTTAALAGEPVTEPAFIAFQRVAQRHAIPAQWPLELLDGFARDAEGRGCDDLPDTLLYCWGVAGTVGVMMALIMGARDMAVLRRAQDLGLAFQLSNICRDIVEDARNGRLYLPANWLAAAGLPADPSRLSDPAYRDALYAIACRLLDLAEDYYRSARVGLRDLPFRGAVAVAAARGIYRAIGRRIRRGGPQALATRMKVPKPIMGLLLGRGVLVAIWSRAEKLWRPPARPDLWSRL